MRHFLLHCPNRLAKIPPAERELYFTDLGEEIARQIDERMKTMTPPANAATGYLDRVRALQSSRQDAESAVLREILLELEDLPAS
jgi:hypothetical protein